MRKLVFVFCGLLIWGVNTSFAQGNKPNEVIREQPVRTPPSEEHNRGQNTDRTGTTDKVMRDSNQPIPKKGNETHVKPGENKSYERKSIHEGSETKTTPSPAYPSNSSGSRTSGSKAVKAD